MRILILFFLFITVTKGTALGQAKPPFTHADTLKGSITPERAWWDVTFYDLHVAIHPEDSTITGWNSVTYKVTKKARDMQIDLKTPLQIDSVMQDGQALEYRRDGDAFFITMKTKQPMGAQKQITVHYSGHPQVAKRPPWDGGFSWQKDSGGRPWIVTTCQGIGASIWWPNKDHQSEEPDSMGIHITVPDPLIDVSNGRLRNTTHHPNKTTTYSWFVSNAINNYDVAVNVGYYSHFSGSYRGEKGKLDLDYWVLDYNLDKAKSYLPGEVHNMLKSFEYWFGPYPFYKDGYKLVDAPHTGMEHQSAIAYGNQYAPGYRGRDGSGTGWGLKWDFIVVHESAHEWWGNNMTTKDLADMWVHEGFANYAENIFVESMFGTKAGAEYVIGTRKGIHNESPIIPHYNVNEEGSGDMYPKGGNMLHTIRQIIDDDVRWRSILRGLNRTFWHQTVTSSQIEHYISRKSGKDLSNVFDQYLRHTTIPVFEYYVDGNTLYYRWKADVDGFNMPLKVMLDDKGYTFIKPVTGKWKKTSLNLNHPENFKIDNNFYVAVNKLKEKPLH